MRKWWKHWWPAAVWAAAIFVLSTSHFSGEETGQFLLPLLQWLLPDATPQTLGQIHFHIRKAGHVVAYFVLSWLVLHGVRGERTGWRLRWAMAAWVIATVYAATDELHQAIVPVRGGAASDILLDSAAAAFAQFVGRIACQRKSTSDN